MTLSQLALDLYCRCANVSNMGEPQMDYWRGKVWRPPWLHSIASRHIGRKIVHGKDILFAGDSTTRDTFYQFVNVAGCPVFNDFAVKEPIAFPANPSGRDQFGHCAGNAEKGIACKRDVNCSDDARVRFRFITKGSSATDMGAIRGLRGVTHAYVQCPVYEWLNPNAYNYSQKREDRVRARVSEDVFLPSVVKGCEAYIAEIRRQSPSCRVHLLGLASFPGWFKSQVNVTRLVQSVNNHFSVYCADNVLVSHESLRPIDRYHTSRKHLRDGIHPTMEAQLAIAETIMRLLEE